MSIDSRLRDFCQKEYSSLTENKILPPKSQDFKEEDQEDHDVSKKKEQQQYNQGRWLREEHCRFIEGLSMYGKNWKKVEEHVATRSGAQIRSHAQKFFNRLEREYDKLQTEQIASQLGNPTRKNSYNFRKRFESIDSAYSHEGQSEDHIPDESHPHMVAEETMKVVIPEDKHDKDTGFNVWINYWQGLIGEKEKELKTVQKSDNEDLNIKQENIRKLEDQIKQTRGICSIISAYENYQEENKGANEDQDQSEQKTYPRDESFFKIIMNKYGKYFGKLYNLVDIADHQIDQPSQSELEIIDNPGKKRRKGSFVLHHCDDDDDNSANEVKLEKFRKKFKDNKQQNQQPGSQENYQNINQTQIDQKKDNKEDENQFFNPDDNQDQQQKKSQVTDEMQMSFHFLPDDNDINTIKRTKSSQIQQSPLSQIQSLQHQQEQDLLTPYTPVFPSQKGNLN